MVEKYKIYLEKRFTELSESIIRSSNKIQQASNICTEVIANDKTIFFCGNGGSYSQALHLAAELTGRFKRTRPSLPSICLGSNGASMTCIGNDFDFNDIFSREIEALGRKGDLLVCLTTSGQSKNVVNAAKAAQNYGITIILLVGNENSPCERYADLTISLGNLSTAQIQEGHLLIGHEICSAIDELTISLHQDKSVF